MNRVIVPLVVVVAMLLGVIAYELHGLNRRLDSAGAYVAGAFEPVPTTAERPETPAERKARLDARVRELQRSSDEMAYVLDRLFSEERAPQPSRQSGQSAAPARSPVTP